MLLLNKFRNKLIGVIIIALVIPLSFNEATAEQSDELKLAIDAWLNSDDKTAISEFSKLALSGDENAMLLLGQISARSIPLSPYMMSLSIKDRNLLLKSKGGFSGKSWLKSVKTKKALANAFLAISKPNTRLDGLEALLKLEEFGPASNVLSLLIDYGKHRELFELYAKYGMPKNMRYMSFISLLGSSGQTFTNLNQERTDALANELKHSINNDSFQWLLTIGHLGPASNKKAQFSTQIMVGHALLWGGEGFYSSEALNEHVLKGLEQWGSGNSEWQQAYAAAASIVVNSEETKYLSKMCQKKCPSEPDACTGAIFGLIGGYTGLMSLQTPVEYLISSSRYFDSKRFETDLLNSVTKRKFEGSRKIFPDKIKSCVSNLFATSQ